MHETILIIDFGSPYSQLIGRRLREINVYCEVHPYTHIPTLHDRVKGVVLSGDSKPFNLKDLEQRVPVFHVAPEEGTPDASQLAHFAKEVCGCSGDWTPGNYIASTVSQLRGQIGEEHVIMAISGGVDSTVAAVLLHKAIGKQLHCVFVDNGLLREDEFASVLEKYRNMGLEVEGIDASARFFQALQGITDPEAKRKAIGSTFIDVFAEGAKTIQNATWLAQGTIYPDVIESVAVPGGKTAVKSHHNVGGLPDYVPLKIVEPLRMLFKDEVRRIGLALGIEESMISRHPFPGPGLGIRILGEVTPEKAAILRQADGLFIRLLRQHGLYHKVWQAGAVLLPVKSVGVTDNKRTYAYTLALRAVDRKSVV